MNESLLKIINDIGAVGISFWIELGSQMIAHRRGVPTLLDVFSDEEINSKLIIVRTESLASYLTDSLRRNG